MIKRIHFREFPDNNYPFNVLPLRNTDTLELGKITILVGDNGSGKSTLLKAIAYYNESINVSENEIDSVHFKEVKRLAKAMKLIYDYKTRAGFFFSGEEFITYINNLKTMKEQLKKDIEEIKIEYKNKSDFARGQALGPLVGSLSALSDKYGGHLEHKSHGEGFLSFFKSRMHQKGLYILDEPETPLSAINQYQLVVMITDLVRAGSQVLIATHSPVIMALKDAKIYNFTEENIEPIKYENIESVMFMKHFLNDKDNFINRI